MNIDEFLALDTVEARCGMIIPLPFVKHAYYNTDSNLCLTLHYIFVRYASTVVAQNGYRLSCAICLFFDYLIEHRAINPVELQPNQFTDISIEIVLGYQDYLLRKKEPISNAEKLKSAFANVAKQNGTIPLLLFPIIRRPKGNKTEPLSSDAYESLRIALMTHIDRLYEKLEFRKLVEIALPYEFDTLPVNDKENPVKIRPWDVDHTRSLKTFLDHGFPMSMSLDEVSKNVTISYITSFKRDCDSVIKVLTHKYTVCANYNGSFSLDQLLEMYFPTSMDQSAIVMFLLLQSGWNKETVLGIDGTDFEHILTGSIDENLAVIFSEKFRSQGLDKPYDAPKQITASSNREDRYSIYSLIKLAGNLSAPLKSFPFDTNPFQKAWEERNPLYLFLRAWGDWFKNKSRHSSISILNSYVTALNVF